MLRASMLWLAYPRSTRTRLCSPWIFSSAVPTSPKRNGSGPAIANALNDDVVNDGANARRAFGSELGCFPLLDRVDETPQIDCSVLNRNGEHGRTPRLRSNPRLYLFTQLGIAGSRKGGKFFGCAR